MDVMAAPVTPHKLVGIAEVISRAPQIPFVQTRSQS